jgi:hypothetical protein
VGLGSFRAGEGFVIIPVAGDRLAEAWPVAVRLGKAHGITVCDPQANRVVRPPGRATAARMLRRAGNETRALVGRASPSLDPTYGDQGLAAVT